MAIRPTMPRQFKGEDHLQPCTSTMSDRLDQVCVVSQKGINEELSYPADTRHIITGAGCNTLANNPLGFCKIASLPKTTTVVPVMNGHARDQAKVSVQCRWPLIRGNLTLKCVGRGIDNVAVQGRWPLTTGVAQGRYYCIYLTSMNDGDGMQAMFQRNRTKWHDSCWLDFNSTQLKFVKQGRWKHNVRTLQKPQEVHPADRSDTTIQR